MARELGPEGIHVAEVIVDGLIENPTTRNSFLMRIKLVFRTE